MLLLLMLCRFDVCCRGEPACQLLFMSEAALSVFLISARSHAGQISTAGGSWGQKTHRHVDTLAVMCFLSYHLC